MISAIVSAVIELAVKLFGWFLERRRCPDQTKEAIGAQDEIGRIAANPPSDHVADDRMRDGSF